MIKKISASLAYRLPSLYKQILKLKYIRVPLKKENSEHVVLMMTGENYIELTRLSILSITSSWSKMPQLIITSDGTISETKIKQKLKFWKGELFVESWETSVEFHKSKGRIAIVNYAKADAFGKKMALILYHASKYPIIWIDSDILFYGDFIPFIPSHEKKFMLGGTEDYTSAYHENVLNKYKNNLYEIYSFSAGLLYAFGDRIYDDFIIENIIESIHPNYDFLTEQSIFAHIASTSLGIIWSKEIIKTFNTDNQQLLPMPTDNIIARHYTSNVRHLFWRDAFFRL